MCSARSALGSQIYGVDQDGILMRQGKISETESQRTKRIGLVAYSASTEPGYSGSPLVAYRNGRPFILGMHVCGNDFRRNCNYGLTTFMLQHFFRKKGILPRLEVADLFESRVDGGMSSPENGSMADANELEYDFEEATQDQYDCAIENVRSHRSLERARDEEQEIEHDDHLRFGQNEDQEEVVTIRQVRRRTNGVNANRLYFIEKNKEELCIEKGKEELRTDGINAAMARNRQSFMEKNKENLRKKREEHRLLERRKAAKKTVWFEHNTTVKKKKKKKWVNPLARKLESYQGSIADCDVTSTYTVNSDSDFADEENVLVKGTVAHLATTSGMLFAEHGVRVFRTGKHDPQYVRDPDHMNFTKNVKKKLCFFVLVCLLLFSCLYCYCVCCMCIISPPNNRPPPLINDLRWGVRLRGG